MTSIEELSLVDLLTNFLKYLYHLRRCCHREAVIEAPATVRFTNGPPPCPPVRRSRCLQARSPRVSFSTNLGHGDAWIDVWTNLQSGDARALSAGARFSPEGRCATASRDRSDVHHSEEPRAGRGDRILGCSGNNPWCAVFRCSASESVGFR